MGIKSLYQLLKRILTLPKRTSSSPKNAVHVINGDYLKFSFLCIDTIGQIVGSVSYFERVTMLLILYISLITLLLGNILIDYNNSSFLGLIICKCHRRNK